MNKVIKKTASYLLVVTLIFTAFAGLQIVSNEAQAASFPTGYPNTYKNTGNYANDIIGVARTQVGYRENGAGTKYGYWYSPALVNQPWCAMFVSWCANQAKVPQSAIKKYASCSSEVAWFKSIGRWHPSKYYGGSYTPKKGDVVFYRDGGSSAVSTHTGVLVGLNGNYLDVIEGNATNESVTHYTTNRARSLDNSYVIGYGNPDYGQGTEPEKEPDTYEVWQVNVDALVLRKSYTTSSKKLASIGFGETIEVNDFKLSGGYLWGKTAYGNNTGWCALNYCDYVNGSIGGKYYQLPPKVTPDKMTIYIGESKKLAVQNGLGVTYTSSDKTVAKVSKKGKVTALKQGTVTIKCKTSTGTANCKVTVGEPHINKTEVISCVGDSASLKVVGVSGTIKWTSSDKKIATVNSAGKVKGISKGTVIITAAIGNVKFTSKVKVYKHPKTYENFKTRKNIYLKNEYKGVKNLLVIPRLTMLKITEVKYSSTLTWGKTKYKKTAGWVQLNNCKYKNGSFMGTVYTIKPYLAKTSQKVYLKNTCELELKDASGTVSYASQDKKIAAISKKGVVTGQKEGTTFVTATVGNTVLKCKIEVDNPDISASSLKLLKAKSKTLKVTGGNGVIEWKSQNPEIAVVSDEGVVTGRRFGETVITAKRNGVVMECEVKVYDPKLSEEKLTLKVGEAKELTVSQSTGAAPVWATSNKKVAVVEKGKITALKAGTANITCKVNGVTLTCVVTVVKK